MTNDPQGLCPDLRLEDTEYEDASGVRRIPLELLDGRVEAWVGVGSEGQVRRRGELVVVTLRGALIPQDASLLHSVAQALEASQGTEVTLDLRGVHRATADAVAALRPLFRRAAVSPGSVRVVGVHGQPLALLTRLQMQRVVALEP